MSKYIPQVNHYTVTFDIEIEWTKGTFESDKKYRLKQYIGKMLKLDPDTYRVNGARCISFIEVSEIREKDK